MPLPDINVKVINGKSGYSRDNSSWVIGRIVRDFPTWMDPRVRSYLKELLEAKKIENIAKAEKRQPGSGCDVHLPERAGLCVSFYDAVDSPRVGRAGRDLLYYSGFITAFLQLGIAAIPLGILSDWSTLLVTVAGILLAFISGALPQWRKDKWACRGKCTKTIVLLQSNGSQHAIVIRGNGVGLDLEDLAAARNTSDNSTKHSTRVALVALALFWLILLITAAGIQNNTWFVLGVGAIGMLQNIVVASAQRRPEAFGVPLQFVKVMGKPRVMNALMEVEEEFPRLGKSMLDTFFPGGQSTS